MVGSRNLSTSLFFEENHHMRYVLVLLATLGLAASMLLAADVQTNLWYQSTVTEDDNGPLSLLAELNYNDTLPDAPIMVVMHGYSPASGNLDNVRANAQRLRDNGFFAVSVAMRGRDGSNGIRDSGGLEIYDIYDCVEAVKVEYAGYVDPSNVSIVGYSGGGGNVFSCMTKFPDYFRVGAAYFGMSDYGFDPTDSWWFANGTHREQMGIDVGDPTSGDQAVLDAYLARASSYAARNNPYSEIHMFVNHDEFVCPLVHDSAYSIRAHAAESYPDEFDNLAIHIGYEGTYEDFDGDGINDPDEEQWFPHSFPSPDMQNASERWFRDRLLSGQIPEPVLSSSDSLFVAGYVVTDPFTLWCGDGQDSAVDVYYAINGNTISFACTAASSDADKDLAVKLSKRKYDSVASAAINGSPATIVETDTYFIITSDSLNANIQVETKPYTPRCRRPERL